MKLKHVYKRFYKDKSLSDFSDYPKDSSFYDPVNKKVIGKMKDDVRGKTIMGFVGLKSKLYYFVPVDGDGIKKAKGVNKMLKE